MKNQIILYLALILFVSCSKEHILIEPINKELNDKFEWGCQYYQVSNFENLSDKDLINQLENFREKSIARKEITKLDPIHILFYKKTFFANYKKYVHEAADNEFGGIDQYRENLVATIIYKKIDNNKYLYTRIIYDNDNQKNIYAKRLIKEDTIFMQ